MELYPVSASRQAGDNAGMIAIVVHGGAGRWEEAERAGALAGVRRAAAAAWRILHGGDTALDAVSAAVVALEDDPLFNAGTGAVLNADGEAELDASIMAGHTLAAGGVTCIRRVRNPVLVARRVMDATDCVLLAGEAATAFAREQGFEDYDPITRRRRTRWEAARFGGQGDDSVPGTVGAVALDATGRLAAAPSTGGRAMKRPGRVGDSPVPGAGNYATAHAAVSATGWGEFMLRMATAKAIGTRIDAGEHPERAATAVLREMERSFGRPIGVICLDARGASGIVHGTEAMPHAWRASGDDEIRARFAA
jgi:beta-aspartyl-peptidase (threonine type)